MYEIKVLDSHSFDKVSKTDPRYSYVDDTNMGFADREKGIAYVRQTGLHDLNKYLISHELEELELDDSTHQDPNGIRHKKFKEFLKHFYNPLNFGDPISKSVGLTDENKGFAQTSLPQGPAEPQIQDSQPQLDFSALLGGAGGGPLGQFSTGSTSSPNVPESFGGNIAGTLNSQQADGVSGINPEVLQKLRAGNYSGRISF